MSIIGIFCFMFIGGMVGVWATITIFWKYTAHLNKEIGRLQGKLTILESTTKMNQKLKLVMTFIDLLDSFFPIKRRK